MAKHPITVAYGDGIGPEIMEATLFILDHAGAQIEIEKVEIGEKIYLQGHPTGIEDHTWESLRRTKVFLKAPITTPQGGGYKSLNVTIRTALGLYANVRPCQSYFPFIHTKHPKMDLVIIRENEEDLYTGIEYRQTPDVCQALKLISRSGCERIIRYGFEYAKTHCRKKVTCFTKDNILKMTDGLFHKVFEEIGEEYPSLIKEHWIVDIGSAKLAETPEEFDVIILPNLYGDILSDVAAQISGSVGLAGSANIGQSGTMFEAIHGSAPKRAGLDVANPSGLLLAAVYMLVHIGQNQVATLIHNAWLRTIEEGIHTYDIFKEKNSKQCVGTKQFAIEVAARLGQKPHSLKEVHYAKSIMIPHQEPKSLDVKRELVGVDVYIYAEASVQASLEKKLENVHPELKLIMITNRGTRIWPAGHTQAFYVDHWRCRFETISNKIIESTTIVELLRNLVDKKIDVIQTENLYLFDGKPGYSNVERASK